mgnify:FL=1|tara:strand:+ start:254 stop:700 length:447 start_codon:yes stop_codon:yes gene_type:complete
MFKSSGDVLMQEHDDTITVSGGFDPVHVGHLRMFQDAAKHGKVIVIANSDDWLIRKKGYVFMQFEERKEIIEAFECVYKVEHVDDTDGTVCEALARIKPTFFANGGDRKSNNVPEVALCNDLGVKLLWNVGGDKVQSSSDLIKSTDNK